MKMIIRIRLFYIKDITTPPANLDHKLYKIDIEPTSSKYYQYRPAYSNNVIYFMTNFIKNIKTLEDLVLQKFKNYFEEFKGNGSTKNYSKIILNYLPILNINLHINFLEEMYKEMIPASDDDENELKEYLEEIKKNFNEINGNIYLYYYLLVTLKKITDLGERISIPTFLYHQLGDKNGNIIYRSTYNNLSETNRELYYYGLKDVNRTNIISLDNENHIPSNISDDKIQYTTNNQTSSYNDIINVLLDTSNRESFLVKQIIKDNYRQSRKSKLPPSLSII